MHEEHVTHEAADPLRRTDGCGTLRAGDTGRQVTLMGWSQTNRDHGGLIFIDLRDRSGIVQCVFNPQSAPAAHDIAESLRAEFVVAVQGIVMPRPVGTVNPNLPTGGIEIHVSRVEVLNPAKTPPFAINDENAPDVDENLRLKYRYLDLRNSRMLANLTLRHQVAQTARAFLDAQGFLEVETPFLIKSTPEGARDFLVPSRLHPGEFYALPQSPQLLKQTLMVAGIERYFQLARCLRDEDLRADRQYEHTQIDLEMSFVEREDILTLVEGLMQRIMATIDLEISAPFLRMSYREAMARFGSDKPDTRFGLELVDVSQVFASTEFKAFAGVLANGGQVKGLNARGAAGLSRRELDELTTFVQQFGAKGLAYFQYTPDELKSPITKFLSDAERQALLETLEAQPGDLLLLVADTPSVVAQALGRLRLHLGDLLGLIPEGQWNFLWVVDFPLFEWNADSEQIEPMHHPFTMPKSEDLPLMDNDPLQVRGELYDLVLNGVELGSGSIRIHRRDIQERMLQIINMPLEQMRERFGFLMEAFEYGAPPHGGIGLGLDRIIALMAGEESIREVIAFPKTASGADLMMDAPTPVDPLQLRDLGLALRKQTQ
ncbi:MAG: aspartate--tRNA ligase [Armatimonadota bacterium]